jgi:hypothetical protein
MKRIQVNCRPYRYLLAIRAYYFIPQDLAIVGVYLPSENNEKSYAYDVFVSELSKFENLFQNFAGHEIS